MSESLNNKSMQYVVRIKIICIYRVLILFYGRLSVRQLILLFENLKVLTNWSTDSISFEFCAIIIFSYSQHHCVEGTTSSVAPRRPTSFLSASNITAVNFESNSRSPERPLLYY